MEKLQFIAPNWIQPAGDFQSVVINRVVASRDHDATVAIQMLDGPVKDGSGNVVDFDHVEACGAKPFRHRLGESGTGFTDVMTDDNLAGVTFGQMNPQPKTDLPNSFDGEVFLDDATDIVSPKNSDGEIALLVHGSSSWFGVDGGQATRDWNGAVPVRPCHNSLCGGMLAQL